MAVLRAVIVAYFVFAFVVIGRVVFFPSVW